ncbi:MAG: HAMP domain-containing sensor histidine kinase [Candidatus Cloacimonetes bacterium]|nr:HAMP domain-containing sensor histidine kinase [Candidatus Cloacimonadota bacterium]
MKFGKKLKNTNSNKNLILRLYFIIGSIAILMFFILYTNNLLKKTREEARIVPNLFARFVTFSGSENFDQLLASYIFNEVILKIDYPIIVTDPEKKPLYWRNLPTAEESANFDESSDEDKQLVLEKLEKMKKTNRVIELRYSVPSDRILGYIYYDESNAIKQLLFVPYMEMGLILIFVVFGVYWLIFLKRNEKNMIWVGLAKETAHQFGTPITSLLGWIDLLQMKFEEVDDYEIVDMLENMKVDVDQLRNVASRFGKMGSMISLERSDIIRILNETIKYFEKRLPKKGNQINIHLISNLSEKIISIDPELVKWTIENLIKNSVDAMQLKGGNIIITVVSDGRNTTISVKDEGKGIPRKDFHRIFEPGITSKERGWGLGLSLAKRIIEDFHHGKIKVQESNLGEGATLEIVLPEGDDKLDLRGKNVPVE